MWVHPLLHVLLFEMSWSYYVRALGPPSQVKEGFDDVVDIRTIPRNFKSAFEENMFFSYMEP